GPNLPHTWHSSPGAHRVASQVVQFLPATWGDSFLHLPELPPICHILHQSRHGLAIEGLARDRCRAAMAGILATPEGLPARLALPQAPLPPPPRPPPNPPRPLSPQPPAAAPPPRTHAVRKPVRAPLPHEHDDPPTQSAAAPLALMTPSAFSRFFHRHM